MKTLTKYIIIALLFVIAIGAAWYSGFKYSFGQVQVEENMDLVLDRVKKVTKLVAVEGYFSELYDYKDYKYYDISFLRKKAMMRIKAKVSVGFDFDSMNIVTHEDTRQIIVDDFPYPSVIAIDHQLDYFDIDEGTFNSFSEKDYNELSKKAKAFVAHKAMETQLRDSANERKKELKEMMRLICANMGWELIFKDKPLTAPYSN
jgi:hypothetical protein